MSSKYLSITTLYTDAQVNIEQFNKILEEKLSWFQEVQETAVKLFGRYVMWEKNFFKNI